MSQTTENDVDIVDKVKALATKHGVDQDYKILDLMYQAAQLGLNAGVAIYKERADGN